MKKDCKFVIKRSSDWFDCVAREPIDSTRQPRDPKLIGMSCINSFECPTISDQAKCKYAIGKGTVSKEITNPVEEWTVKEIEELRIADCEPNTSLSRLAMCVQEILTRPKPKPLYVYWGYNWKKEKSPNFNFNVCDFLGVIYIVPESINI
ncbi:MAG: hypothetical protein PF569_09175 [Candidatus Woesearchaeota archaeon]|jgi:hypothetical protein|nr:hypothetical protein [Candidatus Woesearchaeota archaeon]